MSPREQAGSTRAGGSEQTRAAPLPTTALDLADDLLGDSEEVCFILGMNGDPTWVSPNSERIIGATVQELTRSIGLDLVHPADRAQVEADLAYLDEPGAKLEAEYRVVLGGKVRWLRVVLKTRVDEHGDNVLIGNLRDVTAQKSSEVAVRLEATLLASATQAITALDPDGVLNYWNDAAEALYGWTADEAIGRNTAELIPVAPGSSPLAQTAQKANSDGRGWSYEIEVVRKDGTVIPVMATATPLHDHEGRHIASTVVSYDATEKIRSQEIAARLAAIIETSYDAIFSTDTEGRITTWNDAAARLFGYSESEVVGRTAEALLEHREGPKLDRAFIKAYRSDRAERLVTVGRRADGSLLDVSVSMSPIRTATGNTIGMSMIAQDVTERHRAEKALAHQATHDPLSGLANRRLFVHRLEDSLRRSERSGRHTGVIYIDLDDFKHVNDIVGHVDGDAVLREIGHRISATVGPGDVVGRLGGDEYVVACDGLGDCDDLEVLVGRLTRALAEPFTAGEERLSLTASIGAALSSRGTRAEALIRNADIAMYASKQGGGNRFEMFDDALDAQTRRRKALSAEIDRGLAQGEFRTWFQPEIALHDESLFGFEALVRWNHPTRGLISPLEFVPVAEQSGAILELGRQVLWSACRAARQWTDATPDRPVMVSVNLSPVQVADAGLLDTVREALEESGISAHQLCLEVTESTLMDFESAATAMIGLRDLGVGLAIDDFGTGYSSLSRLKVFPVDFIKIDRSFVDGLGRDPDDEAIVAAVVGMAQTLGLKVIAEGVETPAQRDRLHELGCEYAQGYLWRKPLEEHDATDLAAKTGPVSRSST